MKTQINELNKLRQELIDLVAKFSAEKSDEKLFDQWSLKDLIAHLTGWDAHFIDQLANLKSNQIEKSIWVKIQDLNLLSVKKYSNDQVFDVYKEISGQLIKDLTSLPQDLWDKPLFLKKNYTARKYIPIWVQHLIDHLETIKQKL